MIYTVTRLAYRARPIAFALALLLWAALCAAQAPPPPPVEVPEPLVTNVFADTDLRQALTDVAMQTDVTIIADNTVQGMVTLDLKDVPLERALSMMLRGGGLAFAKVDGYYLVGEPVASNPNYYLLTRSEVIELKHLQPQTMLALLGAQYGRFLSCDTSVVTPSARDPRGGGPRVGMSTPYTTTSLPHSYRMVITAPPAMIPLIRADIERLDRPQSQVMLEASVVEISEDTLRAFGIDWSTRWLRFDLSSGGPNLFYSKVANTETAALTALLQAGKAQLRANPRVTTKEGEVAEIEVGKENYFQILSGNINYQYATLEKITSGILLRIVPHVIEEDNMVDARIEPEVRDVTGKGANGLPEITFRRASTSLRVKDGQSIVIGGLVSETDQHTTSRVPLLGDLPELGRLFRRTNTRKVKTEVVIIITPHIVRDDESFEDTLSPGLRPLLVPPPPVVPAPIVTPPPANKPKRVIGHPFHRK